MPVINTDRQPTAIRKLEPALVTALTQRNAVLDQHNYLAALIRQDMTVAILQETGINLLEEPWELDLSRGVLELYPTQADAPSAE